MANRIFFWQRGSLEQQLVDVFARIKFGASGAPTLQAWDPSSKTWGDAAGAFMGVKSFARSSGGSADDGDYTLLFGTRDQVDTYSRLQCIHHVFDTSGASSSPGTAPTAPQLTVKADNVSNATAPGLRLLFSANGTVHDPRQGEVLLLQITLSNVAALG